MGEPHSAVLLQALRERSKEAEPLTTEWCYSGMPEFVNMMPARLHCVRMSLSGAQSKLTCRGDGRGGVLSFSLAMVSERTGLLS